jgi:hypothetical protein
VTVRIGNTEFDTSLFQKDTRFVVPIRDVIRRTEQLELGTAVDVELRIRGSKARRDAESDREYDVDHAPADL